MVVCGGVWWFAAVPAECEQKRTYFPAEIHFAMVIPRASRRNLSLRPSVTTIVDVSPHVVFSATGLF